MEGDVFAIEERYRQLQKDFFTFRFNQAKNYSSPLDWWFGKTNYITDFPKSSTSIPIVVNFNDRQLEITNPKDYFESLANVEGIFTNDYSFSVTYDNPMFESIYLKSKNNYIFVPKEPKQTINDGKFFWILIDGIPNLRSAPKSAQLDYLPNKVNYIDYVKPSLNEPNYTYLIRKYRADIGPSYLIHPFSTIPDTVRPPDQFLIYGKSKVMLKIVSRYSEYENCHLLLPTEIQVHNIDLIVPLAPRIWYLQSNSSIPTSQENIDQWTDCFAIDYSEWKEQLPYYFHFSKGKVCIVKKVHLPFIHYEPYLVLIKTEPTQIRDEQFFIDLINRELISTKDLPYEKEHRSLANIWYHPSVLESDFWKTKTIFRFEFTRDYSKQNGNPEQILKESNSDSKLDFVKKGPFVFVSYLNFAQYVKSNQLSNRKTWNNIPIFELSEDSNQLSNVYVFAYTDPQLLKSNYWVSCGLIMFDSMNNQTSDHLQCSYGVLIPQDTEFRIDLISPIKEMKPPLNEILSTDIQSVNETLTSGSIVLTKNVFNEDIQERTNIPIIRSLNLDYFIDWINKSIGIKLCLKKSQTDTEFRFQSDFSQDILTERNINLSPQIKFNQLNNKNREEWILRFDNSSYFFGLNQSNVIIGKEIHICLISYKINTTIRCVTKTIPKNAFSFLVEWNKLHENKYEIWDNNTGYITLSFENPNPTQFLDLIKTTNTKVTPIVLENKKVEFPKKISQTNLKHISNWLKFKDIIVVEPL